MAFFQAYHRPRSFSTPQISCSPDNPWNKSKKHHQEITVSDSPALFLVKPDDMTPRPTTTFATTPSEFRLFSKRKREGRRRRVGKTIDAYSVERTDSGRHDFQRLSKLRSFAFWELHRSVAENGEDLIRRMRDYEYWRSRSDVHRRAHGPYKRGRKQSSTLTYPRRLTSLPSESGIEEPGEEEEVQIFSGELLRASCSRSAPHKERHISLDGGMDVDQERHDSALFGSQPYTSPSPTYHPRASAYDFSDETFHINRSISPVTEQPSLSSSPTSLLMSRSEKAIMALSLAMANGAGSLTDYETPLGIQTTPGLDNCQVGEMWH